MSRREALVLGAYIVVALGVGGLGSVATQSSVSSWFAELEKPSWNPPNAIFAPVWTVLYLVMAIVGWRIWRQWGEMGAGPAVCGYWIQLVLNGLWSWSFFWLRDPFLGLVNIVLLWFVLVGMQRALWRIDRPGALLWLPYLLWVSYAMTLNTAIWWLNW
jgi:benzodiazapine receptor